MGNKQSNEKHENTVEEKPQQYYKSELSFKTKEKEEELKKIHVLCSIFPEHQTQLKYKSKWLSENYCYWDMEIVEVSREEILNSTYETTKDYRIHLYNDEERIKIFYTTQCMFLDYIDCEINKIAKTEPNFYVWLHDNLDKWYIVKRHEEDDKQNVK